MTVGDVQRFERVELGFQRRIGRGRGVPDRMHDVVRPRHREQRCRVRRDGEQLAQAVARAIGEQHGPRLRIQRRDVADAIVFLVGPRELVAADAVLLVGAHRADECDPRLRMAPHDHAVEVVGRLAVTNEHALGDEPLEAARALRVGFVGVGRADFR